MKYLLFLFMIVINEIADAQIITTIAGLDTTVGYGGFSGDGGQATAARLNEPLVARTDGAGNLYIADAGNVRVRKVDAAGIITTVAGGGSAMADGIPATAAEFVVISRMLPDTAGNIYVGVDYMGTDEVIKIDTAGIISIFAGGGSGPGNGDGGPATAAVVVSTDMAMDKAGNMYIVEAGYFNVRKVNTSGIISTIAGIGTAGYSGDDGPATAAELYQPAGVAVDNLGNVYIADLVNNRIRKVDTAGIITTIAGTGTGGFSGDGGPATAAELNAPEGIAVDSAGNIYIADVPNHRIRKITAGIITTIAGNSTPGPSGDGNSGDGGPATAAELGAPEGVAVDDSGNVYITDEGYNDVRKVWAHSPLLAVAQPHYLPAGIMVYPNPATTALTIDNPLTAAATYQVTDLPGRTVLSGNAAVGSQTIDVSMLPPGSYIMSLYEENNRSYTKVFVKE